MGCHKEIVLLLLVAGSIALVTPQLLLEELEPPPLPMFSSLTVETSQWNAGAFITVEYLAPEKPVAQWYVDGLPLPEERRVDYTVHNRHRIRGATTLTSSHDKSSQFAVCLLNTVGEICLYLNQLPTDGTVTEDLDFPWPLMTPGPLVRYDHGKLLKIHAPVMDVPFNYTYSAKLISQYSNYLVFAHSRDMAGGRPYDKVTVGPVSQGSGWRIAVRTDRADYEGVLLVNTTYRPRSGLVQSCTLTRPFSIYRYIHSHPFREGFVAAVPFPLPWRCRLGMACMVTCPFLSNGPVNVTISRQQLNVVLNAEQFPIEPEKQKATTRMMGPYLGYGYIFIPNFNPLLDTGTYKCEYRANATRASSEVDVM